MNRLGPRLLAGWMCVFAACSSSQGPEGAAGARGEPGLPGDPGNPGEPAPTEGTLAGTVVDAVAGDRLAGVTVTAADSGGATLATASTGAGGTFRLTVPAGSARLTFAKAHYTAPGPLDVGVAIGRTVNLSVAMSEAASGAPSVTLAAAGDAFGYGATAALAASASDPNGDALAFSWSNATAPLLGSVSGTGPAGSITFPTMAQAFASRSDASDPGRFVSGYALEDRLGIVPIFGDTRGAVTARVTVSDGRGQSAAASLTLHAASVAGGIRNAAVGTRVYLNSGHDGANAWQLDPPAGSAAALDDAASRTPSFVVDVPGTYTATEATSSLVIYGGTWFGAIAGGSGDDVIPDATCRLCHAGAIAVDEFTPWTATRHARTFARGISGADPAFSGACVECHVVGLDAGASNAGFDDAAAAAGWTFPGSLVSSGWEDLWASAPEAARLAGVQCESCHGPQTRYDVTGAHGKTAVSNVNLPFQSPRISYAAEACAVCHGRGEYHLYSEWATRGPADVNGTQRGHSSRDGAVIAAGATGLSASCGRCHSAQGYMLYTSVLKAGRHALNSIDSATLASVTLDNVEPVTCVACHDPHDATNPAQLRWQGDTPMLPSGFAGYGMGKGALCLTCHNSRSGAQTGSDALTFLHEDGEPYNGGNPPGYAAPHEATEGDVFLGRNAYFMGASLPMISRHAAVEDTCVGCHMTLQPQRRVVNGQSVAMGHLFRIGPEGAGALCASCHGPSVDGAGIQGQVEAQLAALASKLALAAKTKLNALGTIKVRAYDEETGAFSSTSASNSNVTIDLVLDPIDSVRLVEWYGQLALTIQLTSEIDIPYPTPKRTDTFAVQLGSLKDTSGTSGNVVYSLDGNFVRAGWNHLLVRYDGSEGLHNPSFSMGVLNATLAKDVSN